MIVSVAYMGVGGVLTLMVPYYLQDADAPLSHAFKLVGLPDAAWVIALGALFGLSTSLLGKERRLSPHGRKEGFFFRFTT